MTSGKGLACSFQTRKSQRFDTPRTKLNPERPDLLMLLYLCRCQTYHIPDPEYLCVPKREALSVSYPLMKTIPILDSASHTPPFLPKFFLYDLRNHTPSSTKFLLPPTSLLTILQLSSPKKPGFPQKHTASSAALKSGGCLVRSFLSHYHFHRSQFSAL